MSRRSTVYTVANTTVIAYRDGGERGQTTGPPHTDGRARTEEEREVGRRQRERRAEEQLRQSGPSSNAGTSSGNEEETRGAVGM